MEALLLSTLAKTGGAPIEVSFDEEAHKYTTADGVIIPSVTTLMKPLTEKAYRAIDREVLRAAAELGTAVHECTEFSTVETWTKTQYCQSGRLILRPTKSFWLTINLNI